MTLKELCKLAHDNSASKGFWSPAPSKLEVHALIHSEISEATEEVRNATAAIHFKDTAHGPKPEGELIELADAIIRIADYCGAMNWDLEAAVKLKMEYNAKRPYKHGKII